MTFKTAVTVGVTVVLVIGLAALLYHGRPSVALLHHGLAAHHGAGDGTAPSFAVSDDTTPEAVRATRTRIAALGKNWNAEVAAATGEIYAQLRGPQSTAGILRTNAIHYGPNAAQTLDLFIPEGGFSELTTVLVYLHGDALAPNADSLPATIASVGGIGVLARYRTGPEARWPSGAEDVRLLLDWVHANIEQHGGDPRLLVLMGNSTGATHIAEYLFDERMQPTEGPQAAAAVLSSGVFDGAFGEDLSHYYASASDSTPLALIDRYTRRHVPLLLWSAEYDPPVVQAGIAELFAKLCRTRGDCPTYERLTGANHVSSVLSVGTRDTAAGSSLMRFYHTNVN